MFNLFNIELNDKDSIEQEVSLSPLKHVSFFYRFLIRFSIFTFKVFNSIILKDIKLNLTIPTTTTNLRSKSRRIFIVPFCNSLKCSRRFFVNAKNSMQRRVTKNKSVFKLYKEPRYFLIQNRSINREETY